VILRGARRISVSAGIHVARILVDASGEPVRTSASPPSSPPRRALARAPDGRVAVSLLGRAHHPHDLRHRRAARRGTHGARRRTHRQHRCAPSESIFGRFVGRHGELRRLGEILARAMRKRTQIVTVQGDQGIGKTRLLSEMERRLYKGRYNVGFYLASCPKNGADVPWSGLTAMLQVLCGVQDGDDESRILDVLPRLRALGLQEDESEAVLVQLGARRSLRVGSPQPGSMLRAAFARMVQSLCDDRLHCFAWDDAQALDKATLEAIVASAGRTGSALRAVFLLATRGEAPKALLKHPQHHVLSVEELPDTDSAHLISTRVGARVLPPELLAFCRERAGGHPLFLEELLKELTDSGALSVMSGVVKARLEGATAVPRSLRALIAARVSRLEPEERAMLQAAAILGEPVPTEVLAVLSGTTVAHVDRTVASLAGKDLMRVTGPALAAFASPMHAEIVLDTLPSEARRELSTAAAAAYLSLVGEGSTEYADRVAHHLYEAGERDRAATYYARAALHRIEGNQLEPALFLLTRALDLADLETRPTEELSTWLRALGDAVARVRSGKDLPALVGRAVAAVDARGTLLQRHRARVDAVRALGSVNLFEEASARLGEAFALAGDDDELRKRTLMAEAEMAGRAGDFTRAARVADDLDALGPLDTPRTYLAIAHARAATGETTAALSAIAQAEALSDPKDLVAASEREKQRVLVYIFLRDPRRAVEASARAVDAARAAGLRFETAAALHNLGDACRQIGDFPRAYATLSESRDLADAAGHERLAALNRVHLAYLDGLAGSTTAEAHIRDYVRYVEQRGYFTDAVEARLLLAGLVRHGGRIDDARREFEETLRLATSYGNNLVAGQASDALRVLGASAV
jgi:tetratricopeptide (TPR) repeat protein